MQYPQADSSPFLGPHMAVFKPRVRIDASQLNQTSGSAEVQGISEDRQNEKNQPSSAPPSGPGGKTRDTQ